MAGYDDIGLSRNFSRFSNYLPLGAPVTFLNVQNGNPHVIFFGTETKTVKDFGFDEPNSRFFFDAPGVTGRWFTVNASTSLASSAPNVLVALEFYKNGNVEEGISISRKFATNDEGNLSASGVVQLSHGDYIELYITVSSQTNITFSRWSLDLVEMVGAIE